MNYVDHYSMDRAPFGSRPTSRLFFQSRTHADAIAFLNSALDAREDYILVTGEHGTGKTLLAMWVTEQSPADNMSTRIFVSTPLGEYVAILQRITETVGLEMGGGRSTPRKLERRLFSHFENKTNPPVLLILDEAQEYTMETLQRLRLLADFNHEGYYPLRLLLFATPDFLDRLQLPGLKAFSERIRHYQLSGLSFPETKEYIYFRLLEAGAKGSPYFPDDVIKCIQALSGGIPRRINRLCDMCLSIGAAREADGIELPDFEEAARYMNFVDSRRTKKETPVAASAAPGTGGDLAAVTQAPARGEVFVTASDAAGEAMVEPSELPESSGPVTASAPAVANPEKKVDIGMWAWRLTVVGLLIAIMTVFLARDLNLGAVLQ